MNAVIKNLIRELGEHEVKIFRQELKVQAEQAKLEVMLDYRERWNTQLEKLKTEERERTTQMRESSPV